MNDKSVFIFDFDFYFFININNPGTKRLYDRYKEEKNIPFAHPLSNNERWEFEERYVKKLLLNNCYIPPQVQFYFQPEIRAKLRELDENFRSGRMSWNMAHFVFETELHASENVS